MIQGSNKGQQYLYKKERNTIFLIYISLYNYRNDLIIDKIIIICQTATNSIYRYKKP